MTTMSDEIGPDGLPVDRDPTLAEIAALPKDGPGRLAALLASASEALGVQVVAVEEMLGMRGEEAARHRLFQVDAFGARVQDIAERLSAVEASLAVSDPAMVEAIDTVAVNLQRLKEHVEQLDLAGTRPMPRETRYAGTEVRVHAEGMEGIDPESFKGPIERALNIDALLRRAETAEAERDQLREHLTVRDRAAEDVERELADARADARRWMGDAQRASVRARQLEEVIAPDGMAAASSHDTTYLLGRVRTLGRSVEKLSQFKTLTHALLDEAKVPTFDGEDCRVKARIEFMDSQTVDKARMLHLVGSLLTYSSLNEGEGSTQQWLTELGLMAGMDPDEEFHLDPEVDVAGLRDIVDSLMFAAPETYGMWFAQLRAALLMEG